MNGWVWPRKPTGLVFALSCPHKHCAVQKQGARRPPETSVQPVFPSLVPRSMLLAKNEVHEDLLGPPRGLFFPPLSPGPLCQPKTRCAKASRDLHVAHYSLPHPKKHSVDLIFQFKTTGLTKISPALGQRLGPSG